MGQEGRVGQRAFEKKEEKEEEKKLPPLGVIRQNQAKMGKNGQKTGERNQPLAKQGETKGLAESWFGIATPWCRVVPYSAVYLHVVLVSAV